MLHRSTSSRRRRASRSVANSPQQLQHQTQSVTTGPIQLRGRRASVASAEPTTEALMQANQVGMSGIDRQRSPRGSCVPNIALDAEDDAQEELFNRRVLPDPDQCGASRLSLAPDANRSSRNSLVPEDYSISRSPRGSLIPDSTNHSPRNSLTAEPNRSSCNNLGLEASRSPRHSLAANGALSPRNSLVPFDVVSYNRSPRSSLVPHFTAGSRTSTLMPESGISRSPRHSLVPDSSTSPRGSVANIEFDRSPRASVCAEIVRSPLDMHHAELKDRSPRGSIVSECINQRPRGSIVPELSNRSPRGSIVPDPNRSPRDSICPEGSNRSPRGSIVPHEPLTNRSPRGSIGFGELERLPPITHRGSLSGLVVDEDTNKNRRNSIVPCADIDRSPRSSSAAGAQDRRIPRTGFTMPEVRRSSADLVTSINRSTSPYKQRGENSGSVRSTSSGQVQANLGYGTTNTMLDSRRASSSVSQFSGDESRRLCTGSSDVVEKGGSASGSGPMSIAAYGSLAFQLKDAHLEASGSCDFVLRALRVVSKTMIVTILLAFLSTMPIFMLILGVQFIRDCPREPRIPVYMVVGGALGSIRMFWTLYSRIRSRRPEVLTMPDSRTFISPKKLASIALSCFLLGWFVLGNYWILSIRWPDYAPQRFEPNRWCHKTLYFFSLAHLFVIYLVVCTSILAGLGLFICRILACPWPERYK